MFLITYISWNSSPMDEETTPAVTFNIWIQDGTKVQYKSIENFVFNPLNWNNNRIFDDDSEKKMVIYLAKRQQTKRAWQEKWGS